ncbi:Hypothetical protein ERS181541_03184 [Mycobacterium tuberculosis]|nr:Hypothetical protein ERS181541_03184 [Mycobacterium tuberculosis]
MPSMKGSSSVSTHAEQLSGRKRATGIPARTVTPCPVRARADSEAGGIRRLLFPAIYLADSAQACMVEVERAAQAASTTAEKMLEAAYRLHTIDVTDLAVLDLTTPQAREAVGLENDDIYGDDWSGCQAVGHAAWFLHMQGVLVPAAGGVGLVVTAYEQRTRPGQLQLRQSVDLTPALYQELRAT